MVLNIGNVHRVIVETNIQKNSAVPNRSPHTHPERMVHGGAIVAV